jgi:steroid delta-isomerase-like uncharacterized protein
MKKYLWVISLVILLCFVFACQDKAARAELEKYKAQAAGEEQNKALVIRFTDAFQKGDSEALKEILSPNYVWHGQMGQEVSREEQLEGLKEEEGGLSDVSYPIQDIFAKGDRVAKRWTGRAVHTGDSEGLPATGKKVEWSGIEIYRIENGKIVESWEIADVLGLEMQLGFELKPVEVKKK